MSIAVHVEDDLSGRWQKAVGQELTRAGFDPMSFGLASQAIAFLNDPTSGIFDNLGLVVVDGDLINPDPSMPDEKGQLVVDYLSERSWAGPIIEVSDGVSGRGKTSAKYYLGKSGFDNRDLRALLAGLQS
ncbi:MAG: hypothetical protein Q8P72_00645 [Candidatus Roizmanbacteria bacterium]|nr:hypothetical protein [Candidatus Roizmanbacteria bacterium]